MSQSPIALAVLSVLFLAACGERAEVNPPTEPAPPVTPPGPVEPMAEERPGTGAPTFIGDWAADPTWCAAPQGERRPIRITATRFLGYENTCDIADVTEVGVSYEARLACVSEGQSNTERVRMTVKDNTLTLDYLDRGGVPVELTKCTTLGDTAPTG